MADALTKHGEARGGSAMGSVAASGIKAAGRSVISTEPRLANRQPAFEQRFSAAGGAA